MIQVCDRRRLVQFSFLSQIMPSLSLLKVIQLIALYSCNTLSFPVKYGVPEFGDWSIESIKPKLQSPPVVGPEYEVVPPFAPMDIQDQNKLVNQPPKPDCTSNMLKILFPLKYRLEDGLMDPQDNRVNFLKLPVVKQPFENYKVLIATAPEGLDLGEDGDKAMTVYIVFNDDRTYPSPMNLPTVYFVKKRGMTHNSIKDVNPILLIDSNRTVTGLRSKEIQKFVRFTNKYNSHNRANNIDDIDNNLIN